MEQVFAQVLNNAIFSIPVILAVVLTRFVLRRSPRWGICLLWGLVAISLMIPFRISTPFSLLPDGIYVAMTNIKENVFSEVNPDYSQDFSYVEKQNGLNQIGSNKLHADLFNTDISDKTDISNENDLSVETDIFDETDISNENDIFNEIDISDETDNRHVINNRVEDKNSSAYRIRRSQIAGIVWLSGIAVMVLYALLSYLILQKRVTAAIPAGNGIYLCDDIFSPFLLGIIESKIYIPSFLSEEEKSYAVSHEMAHRKRGDHLSKFLAFAILSIYWFHPLVWVSFILFGRDLEMACDEYVIRDYDLEKKKEYANALLNCSTQKENLVYPLAFGKDGVKMRIKHIIDYKKPKLWTVFVLAVMSLTITACFMTIPSNTESLPSTEKEAFSAENRKESDTGKTENIGNEPAMSAENKVKNVFENDMEKIAETDNAENAMNAKNAENVKNAKNTKKNTGKVENTIERTVEIETVGAFDSLLHAYKDVTITYITPSECNLYFEPSEDLEGMDCNSEVIFFKFNKLEEGEWKQVNYGTKYEWKPVPIEDHVVEIDWNDTYGNLPAGKYQIIVDTCDSFSGENPDGEPAYGTTISQCKAEFDITE